MTIGTRTLKFIIAVQLSAIAILAASLLLQVNVTVTKKPALRALLGNINTAQTQAKPTPTDNQLAEAVIPKEGVELPIRWGALGKQMVDAGVIDGQKFSDLYKDRGGLPPEVQVMLQGQDGGTIRMTPDNAGIILNLLWAFGLSNKNEILEKGPMQDPKYGGAANFASTGGWTLARGSAMSYYSKYKFVELTEGEQTLVTRVSQNVYRSCCGNSTYFPDCNHGMAMLGLLELMAANGISEDEMYRIALRVNSYWFPDVYQIIAKYEDSKGIPWSKVDPKEVLGAEVSSAQGFQKIRAEVHPPTQQGGNGCGV